MTDNRDDSFNNLTFSQRHGYARLPEPMRLEEVSNDLRRELWNKTRKLLLSISRTNIHSGRQYFRPEGRQFAERILGNLLRKPEDEIDTSKYRIILNDLKDIIIRHKFNIVLDLIEIITNDTLGKVEYAHTINSLFDSYSAAYRLDTTRDPFRFFPRSSEEQGEAVKQATETIHRGGMDGASTHLRNATVNINSGQYSNAVRDSIHAVESVACMIDPRANKTLGAALDSLEREGLLDHPGLKQGFKKLYGYTSDEQGIRHALLDQDSPNVGLEEAVFMFGACASFAAYLVSLNQKAAPSL